MKRLLLIAQALLIVFGAAAQNDATIREYKKNFRTYPFSDPDPVPDITKIYPYFRYDGYTNNPVNKEWKVVELENDFIRVMVLPEIGGKIWAAFEKSTNKSFIYYNQVVKFRDVAMRGPWTSGGLEPNYGIVGHTPNCATPVDYTVIKKKDGSVSCVVGVLDLLTRSVWRMEINLKKDRAYFTTHSTWYNASPFEQPYYHWMNGALRAADDLQFVFPGTKYIGHAGEYANWPVDEKGRDLSFYKNNDFGSYKSYHVFGKHANFWGGYYHNEDFGMARYSTYDDKAGKKIWIWGLSREGMIWEKLLSDQDGQYVEVQSGRLFNQPAEQSSFTPFKNRGFAPHATDTWTEYWYPVKNTKGFVAASEYGAVNVTNNNGKLAVYFNAVQPIDDTLTIYNKEEKIYQRRIQLKTLQVFADSVSFAGNRDDLRVQIGRGKLEFDAAPDAGNLSRPFASPASFDWNTAQGLYIQGKEFIRQRMYTPAEEKLEAALEKDSNYLPALADYAMLMYRQMKYDVALKSAKHALSIDAYDPAANFYYGLINEITGRITDAKDGYAIASQSVEFRSASFTRLATIYHREKFYNRAIEFAYKSIDANRAAIDAYQILAVTFRDLKKEKEYRAALDSLSSIDPLNHFANFERMVIQSGTDKAKFTSTVNNEMPHQTFLELAAWYYNAGRNGDALQVLELAGNNWEVQCWRTYLKNEVPEFANLQPDLTHPFRHETAEMLISLSEKNEHWFLKYQLALVRWNNNDLEAARSLFDACGNNPQYAPFYAARAKFYAKADSTRVLADLKRAKELDGTQWRYGRALIEHYLSIGNIADARNEAAAEYRKHPSSYVIGMLYARALMQNKEYGAADKLLSQLNVLPNEGATGGRILYRDVKLMLAAQQMKNGKFKNALSYINASREWPEQLGSGKPYEDDLDERVQDWLTYVVHNRQKNTTAANASLQKVVDKGINPASGQPSVTDHITAIAMTKLGEKEKALKYLQSKLEKHPENALINWSISAIKGESTSVPDVVKQDSTYQLLAEAGAW